MKKPLIFLSALLLTLPVLAGCTGETVSEPQQAESAAETAAPKELIEIDPFEGVHFTYYHASGGQIKERSNQNYFTNPEDMTVGDKTVRIQILSDTCLKGIRQCKALGCSLKIYRELLDEDLKEGDTVTLQLKLAGDDVTEAELPAYLEREYGIRLKQTTMDITMHFEEEPVEEIDPFAGAYIRFTREDDHFVMEDDLSMFSAKLKEHLKALDFRFVPKVIEGSGMDDLYAGDRLLVSLTLTAENNTYTGKAINQYLAEKWFPVRLKMTEKEYRVTPDTNNSGNINVMLTRSDSWYQIVSKPEQFTKYDLRCIDGSTATIPITAELVRQFCGVPDEEISYYIDHTTTGPAYEHLILGQRGKDIIFVTEPSNEELALAAEHNVELEVTPIALDGFVFITHKDNPVDSLTVEQIQAIYSGAITNWAEVGGYDEEIIAYQREPNSGSQTAMENLVMDGIEMMQAPKERAIMTMGDLIEYVASYKNATQSLGYTFYYYINNLYKNDNIKVLQINGIAPDNENLLDHSYPFSSGYYAVTRKDGDKKAEEIKEFLLSAEGQEIIQLAGYCPVG